jgi:hypothetical protein
MASGHPWTASPTKVVSFVVRFARILFESLIEALNSYRRILERRQHVYPDGIPFVETVRHHHSLNPQILVESRAGHLGGRIVGEAVSYLNCLDWVQPSRFADIPTLCEEGEKSAKLIEDLRLRQPELEVFARKNITYFAMAQEISRHDATLFWIDLKKLGVRCHARQLRLICWSKSSSESTQSVTLSMR